MAQQATGKRIVVRYERGAVRRIEDDVATEWPVTILLNGEEFATLVCSPGDVEDLAIGYMASEGVLADIAALEDISYDDRTGTVYADVRGVDSWMKESGSKRVLTSCCGKSRQGFVFYADMRTAREVASRDIGLTYESCLRMMNAMESNSGLFKATGGVHNAALFHADGTLLLARTDIGRHNAIDKLYGYCLRNGVPMSDKVLAFSGRVSSEVLLKAAKMRCEALLSKSAATDLAIGLAEDLGITIVGFIRGGAMNVYSHPERMKEGE
ncbi:formate dehydrogenase accessory sulfurtransferase FdhD [Cohnella suwonensis]|uniref:Sulfur carrier protein FdhD n=1 Tax=Cohnella suwonensis TaxID=696072 RepID=A0ABW0LWN4_9BACL